MDLVLGIDTMDNDKEKSSAMNLILFDQQAIQNDLPEWTYQTGIQVDLDAGVSETLEVTISIPSEQSEVKEDLVNLTISLNSLGESAFQLQTQLHGLARIGRGNPMIKLGLSGVTHELPGTWHVLQLNTIHALKQVPVENGSSSVVFYLQLSGLSLPSVHAAITAVDGTSGNVQFREPTQPDPKYMGDFLVNGSSGQFSSMQMACEAALALALPASVAEVRLKCDLDYRYTMSGGLTAQIPVGLIPLTLVEDTRSYAANLSQVILKWLRGQDQLPEAKGELKFALSIYAADENITNPLLIIDAITLPLERVQL